MSYSDSGEWAISQLRRGGGELADYDGRCVAIRGDIVVGVGETWKDTLSALREKDIATASVTLLRVRLGPLA